eukprot:6062153-Amphidinium_carterae.1
MQSLDSFVAQAKWLQRELVRAHGGTTKESSLCGKTMDLEHAFRQLAVHPDCGRAACISVWNPVRREV